MGIVAFDPNHHVSERCLDDPTFLMTIFAPEDRPAGGRVDVCTRMKRAIVWALQPGPGDPPGYGQVRRTEVIDALMAASDRKCGRYTAFLQQYDANINGGFGIIAQAASAVATIATGTTSQWLAAVSTVASGSRGTLNNAHFANKAVGILARAYSNRRDTQRTEIETELAKTPADYTLMRGMRDAFRYHASCSIVVGLEETQRAVEQIQQQDEKKRDDAKADGVEETDATTGTEAGGSGTGDTNEAGAAGNGADPGTANR
jgi:hypothetical protein